MKKLNFLIRIGLGILILLFLFNEIGFNDIFSKIISIHPLYFIIIFFIFIVGLVIGALNIKFLLSPLPEKINFSKIIYYNTLSWSIGLFIPGKIGEFLLIPLLKKGGVPIGKGAAISILDKFITLIVLSIFAIMGFFIFFDLITTLIFLILIFLILIFFIFFIFFEKGRKIIKKYLLKKLSGKFSGFSKLISQYIKKEKTILLLNIILTFLKWFFTAFITYVLLLAYNINLPLLYIFLINSMLVIISLIPISISGLGIREYAAVFLFSKLDIEPSITFSIYFIQLIMMYVVATIILFLGLKEIE